MMLSEVGPGLHSPAKGDIDIITGSTEEPFRPKVGSLVSVQSRTWAGINKPGGVGRVSKIYYDSDVPTHVDVKYIVNSGGENHVEMIFVEAYYLEDQQRGVDSTTNGAAERTRPNRRSSHVPCVEMVEESRNDRGSEQHDNKKILKDTDPLVKKRHMDTSIQTRSPKKKEDTKVHEEFPSVQEEDIHHPPTVVNTGQNVSDGDHVTVLISEKGPIQQEQEGSYERIHGFTTVLNKIRIDASLDAINISDLLVRINHSSVGKDDEFTNEELLFYLKTLERENKLMITWEDDMIYWI